jgi:hypothetical protein
MDRMIRHTSFQPGTTMREIGTYYDNWDKE